MKWVCLYLSWSSGSLLSCVGACPCDGCTRTAAHDKSTGERLTIISRNNEEGTLYVKDAYGNEGTVPKNVVREMPNVPKVCIGAILSMLLSLFCYVSFGFEFFCVLVAKE